MPPHFHGIHEQLNHFLYLLDVTLVDAGFILGQQVIYRQLLIVLEALADVAPLFIIEGLPCCLSTIQTVEEIDRFHQSQMRVDQPSKTMQMAALDLYHRWM